MNKYGLEFIHSRIPHRQPFLWLDEIVEVTETAIKAVKVIPKDLDLFQGHYPHYPIVPGVILCEAVFQAGAVLISEILQREQVDPEVIKSSVPVLTRILGAKFKREVGPEDEILIAASLTERVSNAWFMKGTIRIKGKIAVQVEFSCAQKGG